MSRTSEELMNLSDDDFMQELAPSVEPTQQKTPEEIAAEEEAAKVAAEEARLAQEATEAEAKQVAEEEAAKAAAVVPDDNKFQGDSAPAIEPEKKDPAAEDQVAPADATPAVETPVNTGVNYQAEFEKILAPFKANGQMMQVNSAEEAITLMQMGANYTRKMQELQPQRKTLLLLENNGLLDEGKLSYLIDLSKGDPEAIKKLLKDSKFDVIGTDLEQESTYQGGNHTVSDEEVNLRAALDDLRSTQTGTETLQVISSTWDQASKEVLWNNPEVMTTIHAQRESGIYATIVAEIERRKIFGMIQPNAPFLHTYKQVGDELQAAGKFAAPAPQQQQQAPVQPTAPVATKAVLPKPTGAPDSRVAAAAVHHTSVKSASDNSLANLSDDDFLKLSAPR